MRRKRLFLLVSLLVLGSVVLGACAGPSGPTGPVGPTGPAGSPGVTQDDVKKAIDERFTTVDRKLPLWSIQAGTAPRMLELTGYFNNMWYGAQAGNWDLARFEIYRSEETVKAIGVTRPARTALLEAWSKPNLEALVKAVEAKNLTDFESAYDAAIAGCNVCHVASEGGPLKSMGAFKITRPTAPIYSNIDFKGP